MGRVVRATRCAAFQRARTVLVEDLGIDPSPELRNLEQAILEQRVDVDALVSARADRRSRRTLRPIPDLLGRSQEWSVIEEFVDGTRGTRRRTPAPRG